MTRRSLTGTLAIAFAGIGLLAARPAHAQLGGGVPDLSGFAGEIAASVGSDAKTTAPKADGGIFKSGLAVPSVQPGATARGIGRQLRESIEAKAGKKPELAALETEMPVALKKLEAALEGIGFAKRDMGVAMAYTFLTTWETANKQKIEQKPTMIAARNIATAIAKQWGANYAKLSPAAKEKAYESLLISSTILEQFATQFGKAGKVEDEASMRQAAGQMFKTLIGVPPAQVKIDAEGRITGLAKGGAAAAAPAPAADPATNL